MAAARNRGLILALAGIAVLLAAGQAAYRPPAPLGTNAALGAFSAYRAKAILQSLVGNGMPHPIGSAAAAQLRESILRRLSALGYSAELQTGLTCNDGVCGNPVNIIAELETGSRGGVVLLAAHYDSVPAGPGASDDGASVAALLEIAHDLKSLPRPRHSIIFLIDEGEEAGLIGARAFVDWHPWARQVRAAVNLDARGTSGASVLFETGTANQWIVQLFQHAVSHPVTSSIFYDVYRELPNDTDMTVFKSVEQQGANFAYIGSEPQYHTPLDNFADVNPASVQQQGDNALAMTWALANTDLSNVPEKDAVYFDVFGRHVFAWPASRGMPIAIIAALLLTAEIAFLFWTKRMTPREFLSGLAALPLALVSTGALALILYRLLHLLGAVPVNWIAHPAPARIAFWVLALGVVVIHGI